MNAALLRPPVLGVGGGGWGGAANECGASLLRPPVLGVGGGGWGVGGGQ